MPKSYTEDIIVHNVHGGSTLQRLRCIANKAEKAAKYYERKSAKASGNLYQERKPGCDVELAVVSRKEKFLKDTNSDETEHEAFYIAGHLSYLKKNQPVLSFLNRKKMEVPKLCRERFTQVNLNIGNCKKCRENCRCQCVDKTCSTNNVKTVKSNVLCKPEYAVVESTKKCACSSNKIAQNIEATKSRKCKKCPCNAQTKLYYSHCTHR